METFEVVDCASGESVQITCTSEAAVRAQTDNNFLMELLNEKRSSMEIQEILPDDPMLTDDESIAAQGKKWNDSATMMLISLLKQTKGKVGNTFKLKTKKKLYEFIAAEMEKKGYSFLAVQVENKYKGLEKSFRNVTNHNNKTGNNRLTCPFYNELYDLFKDRASMFPEFVLGSSGKGTAALPSTSKAVVVQPTTSFEDNMEEYGNEDDNNSTNIASPCQPIRISRRKPTKEETEERRWQEKLSVMRERNNILERELMRKNDILQDIATSLKQPQP